eukprot:143899_1
MFWSQKQEKNRKTINILSPYHYCPYKSPYNSAFKYICGRQDIMQCDMRSKRSKMSRTDFETVKKKEESNKQIMAQYQNLYGLVLTARICDGRVLSESIIYAW